MPNAQLSVCKMTGAEGFSSMVVMRASGMACSNLKTLEISSSVFVLFIITNIKSIYGGI